MADQGDIGYIPIIHLIQSDIVGPITIAHKYTEYSNYEPIFTSTTITNVNFPQAFKIPWVMVGITDLLSIDCELNFDAYTYSTEKPTVFSDPSFEDNIGEGIVASGVQTIEISHTLPADTQLPHLTYIYVAYDNDYLYRRNCKWFLDNSNGVLPILSSGLGSSGAMNCSYPIGEEQPIDYGIIVLTGSATNELTFTIPANTVTTDTVDAQLLFTLSPYGSNINGTIEDIFTAITNEWFKLYAYDGVTSLKIDVESWNDADDFAKIWVTIPLLETTLKDIVLDFDNTNTTNPDSSFMTLIGF